MPAEGGRHDQSVKFVGIPVADQERALAFYRDKLGFKVHTDQPLGKQRWIEPKIPGAETGVVLFTPDGHENRIGTYFNGAFACDNVQKTYEELTARGVSFKSEPKQEPWGTFATFQDSEGKLLRPQLEVAAAPGEMAGRPGLTAEPVDVRTGISSAFAAIPTRARSLPARARSPRSSLLACRFLLAELQAFRSEPGTCPSASG